MKFLIQKINGQIVHDFSFTLLESIRYNNWIHNNKDIKYKFKNIPSLSFYDKAPIDVIEPDDIYPIISFEQYHYAQKYVPIGSVEFVNEFLSHFYGFVLQPTNVPEELFHYAGREIFNGTEKDLKGKMFVKSNNRIKGTCGIWNEGEGGGLPVGNYQFSDVISDIESEWRAFVYEGKLVGLQNYSGDFTRFPNVKVINGMIKMYNPAPVAYTLDVGISASRGTLVIETHPMVSVGLYGMVEHKILPYMFYKCFWEIVKKEGKYE
jgi:hypothetical protein